MIIYLIRNKINNKMYVGQTKRTLNERIAEHIYDADAGIKNYPLYRSIRKNGIENFEWQELSKASSKEDLNEQEIAFIKKFNSFSPQGYNLTRGGNIILSLPMISEIKEKILRKRYGGLKKPRKKYKRRKIREKRIKNTVGIPDSIYQKIAQFARSKTPQLFIYEVIDMAWDAFEKSQAEIQKQ